MRNLIAALLLTFCAAACSLSYDISVLGNVYDENGVPRVGLSGNFCWTIHYTDASEESLCQPVSTNGEGQFSTAIFGTAPSEMLEYTYYLEVGAAKYTGKMIQESAVSYEEPGVYKGTAVVNITVPVGSLD